MCFINTVVNGRDGVSQLLNPGCEGGKTREVETLGKTVLCLNILL